MTDVLIAPSEQWLNERVAPDWALTQQEQDRADQIQHHHGDDIAEAALGISAAFLLYRAYGKRQLLAKMMGQKTDSKKMSWAQRQIWASFAPTWVRMIVPHLITGYMAGLKEANAGAIPEAQLLSIAQRYAEGLGQELHDTSSDAVMIGYQAQINRKIPSARAVQQVAQAYGVPPRAMNALVTVWNSEDPKKLTNVRLDSIKDARVVQLINSEVNRRAKTIGDNETWAAKTQAKQIVWMYGVQQGVIPKGATRTWITARDERVCPYCGPMQGTQVKVNEKFDTKLGKIWSPPSHVNCRCDVSLDFITDEDFGEELRALADGALIMKALGDDPYDRDNHGRFASEEERTARTAKRVAFKEHRTDPAVANLIREAQQKYGVPEAKEIMDRVEQRSEKIKSELRDQKLVQQIKVQSDKLESAKLTGNKLGGKLKPVEPLGKKPQKLAPALTKMPLQKLDLTKIPKVPVEAIKANAPQKLKSDIETFDGEHWHKLDEPLFGVLDPYESNTGTIYTDENTPFVGKDGVDKEIANYWLDTADEANQAYAEAVAGRPGYVVHINNVPLIVTDQDFSDALECAISGVRRSEESIWLDSVMDESDREPISIPISPEDLAQIMEMPGEDGISVHEWVQQRIPTVYVTLHGRPGVTDITNSKSGYSVNPGKWKVVGTYSKGGVLSMHPYEIKYVEPID